MAALHPDSLSKWAADVAQDPTLSLAAAVASNVDVTDAFLKRERKDKYTLDTYNVSVDPQGSPITDQKQSGRCWLFAATNMLRIPVIKKYNLDKLQLSPSFLFFYDKLEKSNYFLEQIIDTAKEDVDSRLVQHLLTDPICDGGQFGMIVNIVNKYGLVPNSVYPDNFNTTKSTRLNALITTLLRQYAQELREAIAKGQDPKPLQQQQIQRVHQILVVFLGKPPGPDEEFVWDYEDKDKKVTTIKSTPLKFAKEFVDFDANNHVSLLHDPRNEYNRVIGIERLGNVVGAPDVTYLNVNIDFIVEKAIERLKNNKAVFLGTHTPLYHHTPTGVIDTELWDYKALGFDPKQQKADRLRYHESLMTHAMCFTAVHLDEAGKPVRWKVENSWGESRGRKGFYSMSHEFFVEYIYQIVVEKDEIPDHVKYLETKPILLPPWDPCGALATN